MAKIRYDIEATAAGAAEVDQLATELERLDGAVDPQLAERARALAGQLRTLGEQQAAIDAFVELKQSTAAAAEELETAQTTAQAFGRQLSTVESPTRAQAGQLEKLRDAVRAAKAELQAQTGSLDEARAGLTALGIPLSGVAERQVQLRQALRGAREELQQIGQAAEAARALSTVTRSADQIRASMAGAEQALQDYRSASRDAAAGAGTDAQRLAAIGAASTGSAADVRALAQQFEGLNTAFDPAITSRVQALAGQLRGIADQQGAIDTFRALKTEATSAAQTYERLQASTQAYARQLAATSQPTSQEVALLERMRAATREAQLAVEAKTASLNAARTSMAALGVPTEGLAARQAELRTEVRGAREELDRIGQTAARVTAFERIAGATEDARVAVLRTEAELERFRATLTEGEAPTRAQALNLERLAAAANQAQRDFLAASQAQAAASAELRAAGINVDAVVAAQQRARAGVLATAEASRDAALASQQQGRAASAAAAEQVTAAQRVRGELSAIGNTLRNLQALAGAALGGQVLAGTLGDLSRTADAYSNLYARIGLVTGQGPALAGAFEQVFEVARRTNSQVESTGTLFARLAEAGKSAGQSTEQATATALSLVETINQAVQVSGVSAESSDAAITQLIQGLQSGVLRGEEFNSVMEQAPRLAKALADGLGVTTGELRKQAEAGRLTSQVVIEALQGQAAVLAREFEQLPPTVGRAITNLSTSWTQYVGEVDRANGISATAAGIINTLAENLDTLATVLIGAGKAAAAYKALDLARNLLSGLDATTQATAATAANTAATTANTAAKSANAAAATINRTAEAASIAAGTAALTTNTAARQADTAATGAQTVALQANTAAKTANAAASVARNVDTAATAASTAATAANTAATTTNTAAKSASAAAGNAVAVARERDAIATAQATAATAANTAATAANTAAKAGAAASLASVGSAAAEAAGTASRLAGIFATLRTFTLIGLVTNLESIGTAIGEGVAKWMGYGKAIQDAESKMRAQEAATQAAARETAALAQAAQQAADRSLGLNAAAKLIAAEFDAVRTKGGSVAEALDKVGKALQLGDLQGIRDAGAALDSLAVKGQITAEQLRTTLAAALKDVDLLTFETQARAAFDGSEQGARRLAQAIDAVGQEALRRAGTSAQELQTGFSAAMTSAVNDVDLLARELQRLQVAGAESGRLLSASLSRALDTASTERAVQAVISRFEDLGRQGLLTGQQLAQGLDQARAKLDELRPGISSLDEALATFGIKSRAELQATADNFQAAWEQIRNSTQVGLQDKIRAFEQFRDAAIAANDGVIPSEVRLQEEMLRIGQRAREVSTSFDQVGQAGTDNLERIATAAQRTAEELSSIAQRNQQLTEEIARSDAERRAINRTSSDNTGLFSLQQKAEAGTLSAADLNTAQAVYTAARTNAQIAGENRTAFSLEGLRSVEAAYASARDILERVQSLATRERDPRNSQPQRGTIDRGAAYTVNIRFDGGRTRQINTASAQDAQALTAVLDELRQAASRTS